MRADAPTADAIQDVELHSQMITGLCESPDGTTVMSVARDNTAKLVDMRTFSPTRALRSCDFAPVPFETHYLGTINCTFLLSAAAAVSGLSWSICCCNLATLISSSPDGQYCACGTFEGNIIFWNALTGSVERVLEEPAQRSAQALSYFALNHVPCPMYSGAVACCAWSPNGEQLAACDKEKTVVLWR